jgi:hypothetical protein
MKRKEKLPTQYAIVRLVADTRKQFQDYLNDKKGCYKKTYCSFCKRIERGGCIASLLLEDNYIFLGEIPNMRGHVVVAGLKSGKIFSGYHSVNFEQLSDEET